MEFFRRHGRRPIVWIFLASFVLSAGYAFYHRIVPAVDARAYDQIAQNLLAGHGFKEEAAAPLLSDRAIQRAGPGYEFFLSGLYAIFGRHYEVVWVAQALLHALTAFLVFGAARRLFLAPLNERAGLVAAALIGFHPDLIENSAMLLTETLYVFFVALIIYLFILVYQTAGYRRTLLLAAAMALGFLSRPTVILFVPIIGIMYWLRHRVAEGLVFGAVFLVLLAPWSYRNWQVYHQFIPTTLIGEYNLWVGNTTQATGGQLANGYNPWDEYVGARGYGLARVEARSEFNNFIAEHPRRFIELTFIRTIRFFSLIRPLGFWFYQTGAPQIIFVAFSGAGIALLFIFGFAGLIQLWRSRERLARYLILLALTAPIPLVITVVQSRYRFQIYPFLALFSGYFVAWGYQKRWWKEGSFKFALLFLLVISLVDAIWSSDIILDRLRQAFL